MEVTFYCGCVWGKKFQAKGAASAKALRSLVLGMLGHCHGWLVCCGWWIRESSRKEVGRLEVCGVTGLVGQMLLDALASVASQLPRAMHANGFLPAVSHLRFSLATGASPGCSRVPQESQRVG